jgi:ribonuclease HI
MAPQEGWLKINVDRVFDESSGEGATGVVVRDSSGRVVLAAKSFFRSWGTVEEMEATACKEGLMLAADWCPQRVILETDCSTVASMLAARDGGRTMLKFIIDETVKAGDQLPRWTVVHKRRESSCVAHELAQLAKRTRQSTVWHSTASVCVKQIITPEKK